MQLLLIVKSFNIICWFAEYSLLVNHKSHEMENIFYIQFTYWLYIVYHYTAKVKEGSINLSGHKPYY